MEAPPNMGAEYTSAFRQVFRDVAQEHGAALLPFLLEGVAGDAALNQPDGIHPNAEGARRIADLVWRALEPMLVHT
jgi:acyl-CoA thioesterase-1